MERVKKHFLNLYQNYFHDILLPVAGAIGLVTLTATLLQWILQASRL